MEIKKYFKKETHKHYILCSIPFIITILFFICLIMPNNGLEQKEQVLTCFILLCGVPLLIGIILICMYVYSCSNYKRELSSFNKKEIERINNEAETVYNMGKILITNDVLIFFGFFKKKVIPTKIIEKVDKIEGTYTNKGRGTPVSIDYHTIILKCRDNEQVMIPAPKNYNNTECENCKKIIKYIIDNKKLNKDEYININSLKEASVFKNYKENRLAGVMDLVLAIPYLLICLIINRLIKICINNGSGLVLKVFYSVGFEDLLIFIELVTYIIIFIIINVYNKFYSKNIVKGNTAKGPLKFAMLGTLILFSYIAWSIANYDYKKVVRSDYISYLKNESQTYIGKITYPNSKYDDAVSWISYYKGNINILRTDNKVFISTQGGINKDKIYKIKYLPKTHLIVEIKEQDGE